MAQVFKKHGINTLKDFSEFQDKQKLEIDICSVKGQGSGIMMKYLYMLAGDKNTIKPDRHITNFIHEKLPELKHDNFQNLISGTVEVLKKEYPDMTPHFLDFLIWEYQSGRKPEKD